MSVYKDVEEIMTDALKDLKKKGSVAPSDLETTKTIMEIIDLIDKKCERMDMNPDYEEEYSGRRMGRVNMNYSGTYRPMLEGPRYPAVYDPEYSWGDGYSNNNGGRYSGENRNRDSMGRYSSGYDRYDRRYSRDGATKRTIEKLEDIMSDARNEEEREIIRTCINKLTW